MPTLSIKQIKRELWDIAQSYPTLAGILQKKIGRDGKTVGSVWVRLMKDLDSVHLENVMTEFAQMERPLPTPIDQLAYEIIDDVKDRMCRAQEKLEQYEKYHKPFLLKDPNQSVLICRILRFIFDQPRGSISNDQALQLISWDAGGKVPQFIEDHPEAPRYFGKLLTDTNCPA